MPSNVASTPSVFSLFSPHRGPLYYLDIVRIRKRWVIVPLLVGMGLSYVAFSAAPKRYSSSAVIFVHAESRPDRLLRGIDDREAVATPLNGIEERVTARSLVERLVEETNPYPELGEGPNAPPKGVLTDYVRSRISVSIRRTDTFAIRYSDSDPERAQLMCSRLASLFIEEEAAAKQRLTRGAAQFVAEQLRATEEELKRKQEALRSHKQRYAGVLPAYSPGAARTLDVLQAEAKLVTTQLAEARERRRLMERQIQLEREISGYEERLTPTAASPASTPRGGGELEALRAQRAELRKRYADEHPEIRSVDASIARLEKEAREREASALAEPPPEAEGAPPARPPLFANIVQVEQQAQLDAITQEVRNLERRHAELSTQIDEEQRRFQMLPMIEQESEALNRDYQLVNQRYQELMKMGLEVETAGAVQKYWKGLQFEVVSAPRTSKNPDFPIRAVFLGVGAFLGLVVGVGLAVLMEFLDHSVKDRQELKALLPYTLLIELPEVPHVRQLRKGAHAGLLTE
jgi:polysaccharide chain length determinant protein (PEP-CTERM system associated)